MYKALGLFLGIIFAAGCGGIVNGPLDEQDPTVPPEDVEDRVYSTMVLEVAHEMILDTRPKATTLVVKQLNLVLANNGIIDETVSSVEQDVLSPLTDGVPKVTCPYLTKAEGSSTISCRYLVDRAVEDAMLEAPKLETEMERQASSHQQEAELDEPEMIFVKGWISEAVKSGIDVGVVHTLNALRKTKVCDQAPSPKASAFKLGEQQGRAILEQAEKRVMPTIPKTLCETDVIAATVYAEAKKDADTFVAANPICKGYKAEDLSVAVDLAQAENNREDGLKEGSRQAYEALRVRLVSTWECWRCGNGKCDPNESCSSCAGDCGQCPPVCGNGKCETGESCSSCSSDCGSCQTGTPPPNTTNYTGGKVDCACFYRPARNGIKFCVSKNDLGGKKITSGLQLDAMNIQHVPTSMCNNPPVYKTIGSPLVLDLDDNGIVLADKRVRFDLAGTGERVWMPALTGRDALLALDLDRDDRITSGRELFGNATACAARRCTDGLEALRQHDRNTDGFIDAKDRVFARLLLWRDANHDGKSQPGELQGLPAAGIRAVLLEPRTDLAWSDGRGNSATRALSFRRDRGPDGVLWDVWFSTQLDGPSADPRTSGVVSTLR